MLLHEYVALRFEILIEEINEMRMQERIAQCENAISAHLRANDELQMEKEPKEKNEALETALEEKRDAIEVLVSVSDACDKVRVGI